MVLLRTLVAAMASMSSVAYAQTPASVVVEEIRTITIKSRDLQAPAQALSIRNAPLLLVGSGPWPAVIRGFADIVVIGTRSIPDFQSLEQVPAGAQADLVFDAFRQFVIVHQDLLSILIGKAGFLNSIPFVGPPVAAVLRQVEGVVDTVAFALISKVESRAADFRLQASSLDGTIIKTMNLYSVRSIGKRDEQNESVEAFVA